MSVTSDFLHQETDYHDITEILWKVALNTITLTLLLYFVYLTWPMAKWESFVVFCLSSTISQLTPGKWYRFMFVFSSNNTINNYYMCCHINDNYIYNKYYIFPIGTMTSTTISGISENVGYFFKIRACTRQGEGHVSQMLK